MKKEVKNRFRSWITPTEAMGETNTKESKTMPGMEVGPHKIIENHVRGINPITGAVLDRGLYYGENIVPYEKDLTYEELRLKRLALHNQVKTVIDDQEANTEVPENGNVQEPE